MTRQSARRLLGLSVWAAAFALCLARYIRAIQSAGPGRFPDLYVYRGAIKAMMADGSLYAYAAKSGDPFTYPPAAAWMLAPIAWIPTAALEPLWFTLELLTLAWLAVTIARIAFPANPTHGAPWIALALSISAPVASNIEFGQVSLFILSAMAATVLGRAQGLPLGFAGAAKLIPVGAIPFVFAQGRRRTAVIALATFCALTALTWVLMPGESTHYWLHVLPQGTSYGDASLPGNQSLLGVLARSGVSGPVGRVVWVAASLGLGLWSLVRVRALHRNHRPLQTLAVVAALLVVISPVSWTHHQLLITIAALWPLFASRVRQISWSALIMLVMSVNLWNISAPGPLGWALQNSRFLLALTIIVALPVSAGTQTAARASHRSNVRPHNKRETGPPPADVKISTSP